MSEYSTPNRKEQGGASWVVGSGGSLSIESGGSLDIESGGLLKFAGTDKAAILAASVANQVAGTASGKKVHGAAATVSAGEDTAGTKTIATGVTIASAVVQIVRAGAVVTDDAAVSYAAENLVVADGATYVLTENDVINYLVFGT